MSHSSRAFLDLIPGGIFLINGDGTIAATNKAARRFVGLSLKISQGIPCGKVFHLSSVKIIDRLLKKNSWRGKTQVRKLLKLRQKGGRFIDLEALISRQGTSSSFQVLIRIDIPDPTSVQDGVGTLLQLELTEGVFVFTSGGHLVKANRAFENISGYKVSARQLLSLSDVLNPPGMKRVNSVLRKGKAKRGLAVDLNSRDGGVMPVMLDLKPFDVAGVDGRWIGVVRALYPETSTAQSEIRKLINVRDFLENVINTVATPIFVKNERFEWILFNKSFLDGRKSTALLGKTDHDFLPRPMADQIRERDVALLRNGKSISHEEVIPDKNGRMKTVITSKSRFVDAQGKKFVIGVIIDISERKRFENMMRYHNASFKAVLESTDDQVLALDLSRCYVLFNHAHAHNMRKLYGKVIHTGDHIMNLLPPPVGEELERLLAKAYEGMKFTTEMTLPNKAVYKVSFNPIRDEHNRVEGVALFANEITDRKKTEMTLKALNEELTEQNWQLAAREDELKTALDQLSERNFELDQLMYKTSHDLRSPLSSILGLVNLAHLDQSPENLPQYLVKIEGRIKKLDEFISSMVNYARVNRGEITITEIDLEALIRSSLRELEYLDNFQQINTAIEFTTPQRKIKNDAFLLNIVVGNIMSNAYKYYNPETDSYLRIVVGISEDAALLEFEDNGIGIREEHHERIFDMFYRATDRSKGSGLGMYIVKQAIEKINGSIVMQSEYGKGTRISIEVPNLL